MYICSEQKRPAISSLFAGRSENEEKNEQDGNAKAQYGAELLDNLAKDLTTQFGKGFSRSNLFQVRLFYLKFPKIQTLSGKLSWSHYTEIIKANSDLEIGFYTKQCENENWSVRELKRQMKSLLFHRIALSKDKKSVLEISKQVPTLSSQARGIAGRT